jgi:hypothetical protein
LNEDSDDKGCYSEDDSDNEVTACDADTDGYGKSDEANGRPDLGTTLCALDPPFHVRLARAGPRNSDKTIFAALHGIATSRARCGAIRNVFAAFGAFDERHYCLSANNLLFRIFESSV